MYMLHRGNRQSLRVKQNLLNKMKKAFYQESLYGSNLKENAPFSIINTLYDSEQIMTDCALTKLKRSVNAGAVTVVSNRRHVWQLKCSPSLCHRCCYITLLARGLWGNVVRYPRVKNRPLALRLIYLSKKVFI